MGWREEKHKIDDLTPLPAQRQIVVTVGQRALTLASFSVSQPWAVYCSPQLSTEVLWGTEVTDG